MAWRRKCLVFALLSDSQVSTDHAFFDVTVPYSGDMRHISLYKRGNCSSWAISAYAIGTERSILRENYLSYPEKKMYRGLYYQ